MTRIRSKRSARIAVVAALGLTLSACGGQIAYRGYQATDIALEQIQIGSSKEQVRLIMGTPSATSTLGQETYYYVSSTEKQVLFLPPKTVDRRVLAFEFDTDERVSRIANYGIKDGVIFDYISRKTPTRGDDLTALRQIFGNLVNLNPFGN